MDGFTAFIIWSLFLSGAGFAAGKYLPQSELGDDCKNKGEMVVSKTIYTCKAIGTVDGEKRYLYKE